MERMAFLGNISIAGKIMLLLGLILLCTLLTAFGGLLIGKLFLNVDIARLGSYISEPKTDEAIVFIKFYQFLNQLGTFILPVLLYSYFVSAAPMSYLKLTKKPKTIVLSVSFLIIFTILPFINYLEEINQSLQLPELLSGIEEWISDKEQKAAYLTEIIIKTNTFPGIASKLIYCCSSSCYWRRITFQGYPVKTYERYNKECTLGSYNLSCFIQRFSLAVLWFLTQVYFRPHIGLFICYYWQFMGSYFCSLCQ